MLNTAEVGAEEAREKGVCVSCALMMLCVRILYHSICVTTANLSHKSFARESVRVVCVFHVGVCILSYLCHELYTSHKSFARDSVHVVRVDDVGVCIS